MRPPRPFHPLRPARCAAAALLLWGAFDAAMAASADADSRARSLAKYDVGYAQCEQRVPAMRGQRDEVYAKLYKLKADDALRSQLAALRASPAYKAERTRSTQRLAREAKASDVSHKLDLQCQGLQREAQR